MLVHRPSSGLHTIPGVHLDECRRRVQNDTLGHRGHKDDPLYRWRRLLTKADERLDNNGCEKLLGLLDAGDPRGNEQPHQTHQTHQTHQAFLSGFRKLAYYHVGALLYAGKPNWDLLPTITPR